jgi:hypothetical protein
LTSKPPGSPVTAAVASAGAPIVANRASAAPKAEPVEKEMDDKIEATVSKLAEPAMEIPQEAKDVYEGLQDKPVEESMEMPDYAKEVYEGAPAPVVWIQRVRLFWKMLLQNQKVFLRV